MRGVCVVVHLVGAVSTAAAAGSAHHAVELGSTASSTATGDHRRVNAPAVPFGLAPLQWGSVRPKGWIKDWALSGREGLGSPEHAPFAHIKDSDAGVFHSGHHHIGNSNDGGVDGWKNGRPNSWGFWDEDSAYWIDGMTRMGAVLNDTALKNRVFADYASTIAHPIRFHNTWTTPHDLHAGSAEGWVRSIYSRGMLAYYDYTGDKRILSFLVDRFSNYTAADSTSDRSLTQIEALLESHAYGGPVSMKDTALAMMATNPVALRFQAEMNSGACLDAAVLDPADSGPAPPAPSPTPTPVGPPPPICDDVKNGSDLSGGGVIFRKAHVTVSQCCEMCVANARCGGWVHCPSCPLNLDGSQGPRDGRSLQKLSSGQVDTPNCFLIGGHVTHRPAPATGSHARSSGIVRAGTPQPPTPPHGAQCSIKGTHGVTFNELAKLHAMAYSWNGNHSYLNASLVAYEMLQKFDVQVHGVNSAQEALSGISPNVGTETCDIVDFSYSNEWLLKITGNARLHGDRLEKAFHNAAPGAINRTFTGHVYHQSPNLVATSLGYNNTDCQGDRAWRMEWFHATPCCTGNQARLLPNYIHSMWHSTADGGLAATMYGPNTVHATVGGGAGAPQKQVEIAVTTAYPFSDTVIMTVTIEGSKPNRSGERATATFPLALRIPAWCVQPSLSVAGKAIDLGLGPDSRGFVHVARTWRSGDQVNLTLPAVIRATKKSTFANGREGGKWNGQAPWGDQNVTSGLPFCVVERGSLTFALPMESDPSGAFGYALDCNASTMVFSAGAMPSGDWNWPLDAPVKIVAKAKPFNWADAWRMPDAPVAANETTGPEQLLTLVPYGCTKVLRISMFPYLA